MGFLGVNRRKPPKRKLPNHHHAKPSKKPNVANTVAAPGSLLSPPPDATVRKDSCLAKPISHKGPLALPDLPREILEIIFVQSGNLALPSASKKLAHSLSRSPFLERQLITSHLSEDRELPCELVAHWPFVTASLLRDLDVAGFCGLHKYVPGELELGKKTPEKVALLAYMVEKGCEVEDPEETYLTLMTSGHYSTIARSLVRRQARCDHRSVLESLRCGQAALAHSLIPLCKDLDEYGMDMYTVAREKGCIPVLEALRKILFPETENL